MPQAWEGNRRISAVRPSRTERAPRPGSGASRDLWENFRGRCVASNLVAVTEEAVREGMLPGLDTPTCETSIHKMLQVSKVVSE